MSGLILENVEKHYGSACAVKDVNLHLPEGKLVCFLGPSGCGKTTLLRCIAGLEKQDSGELYLGERDVSHLAPQARDYGILFQSYAPTIGASGAIFGLLLLASTVPARAARRPGRAPHRALHS